ncbi:3'-5' exonuclease [Echinimonas agarilytica]|uniref:Exonuclease n=1 Tax=Echinimonas agarilytica TaxID=1215918 RepID=A0AA41W8P4_9GAMM|nr:hypothetical protein [Echinimonas agarilytica]MCM2680552.1 hypothetical protein [Echinimonas agarilytica]
MDPLKPNLDENSATAEAYNVIDIEASGFGRGSYPIEIGVCLANQECHCFLIKPESSWVHWSNQAEQIHGISREIILTHGISVREVAETLNKLLKGLVIYSDAWGQDQSWLMKLYDAAGMWPNYKLETIRSLMNETQLNHYHSCQKQAQDKLHLRRHRASSDARVVQYTLSLVQQK